MTEFVAGPENALAVAALAPLIERQPTSHSPLVLYGPHGSGKSHLARGLADLWRKRHADAQVECLTGAELAQQYAAALADGHLEPWRAELRSASLFVLDDLAELRDKLPAQRELLRTLDTLADQDALVVITARSLPSHWPALLPALRSRLSGGLAVPLAYPARATRRVILERLTASRGVSLPPRALDGLARALDGSVSALVAAILELEMTARVAGQSVDPQRVRQFVAARSAATQPTLREIACATAKYFGLTLSELKSPARQRSLVAGRGVAMLLARQLTPSSLEQIGEFFGRRDHTTVLHACRRTEKLLSRDSATRLAIAELKKHLAHT